MLPAGEITEDTITKLGELLDAGDAIIDGGNAFYRDDVRRAEHLRSRGIAGRAAAFGASIAATA